MQTKFAHRIISEDPQRIFRFAESRIHFYFFAANFDKQQGQPIRTPLNSNNNDIADKIQRFQRQRPTYTRHIFPCFDAKISLTRSNQKKNLRQQIRFTWIHSLSVNTPLKFGQIRKRWQHWQQAGTSIKQDKTMTNVGPLRKNYNIPIFHACEG